MYPHASLLLSAVWVIALPCKSQVEEAFICPKTLCSEFLWPHLEHPWHVVRQLQQQWKVQLAMCQQLKYPEMMLYALMIHVLVLGQNNTTDAVARWYALFTVKIATA